MMERERKEGKGGKIRIREKKKGKKEKGGIGLEPAPPAKKNPALTDNTNYSHR